jgi:hypothetical protein
MRSSQTVVLAALGVVALGIVLAAGLAHVVLSQGGNAAAPGEAVSRSLPLTGFTAIDARGGSWSVTLARADTWNVEITYPEDLADDLQVRVDGDRLVLDARRRAFRRGPLTAQVAMPELNGASISGAGTVDFSGFSGDRLALTITGSGTVQGRDGSFKTLSVRIGGSGRVDVRAVPTVDAEVNVSGSGHVSLTMNGGSLTGSIAGSGKIDYSGSTHAQQVTTSGSGQVTQTN